MTDMGFAIFALVSCLIPIRIRGNLDPRAGDAEELVRYRCCPKRPTPDPMGGGSFEFV